MTDQELELFHDVLRERALAARRQALDIEAGVITDSFYGADYYHGKFSALVSAITLYISIQKGDK